MACRLTSRRHVLEAGREASVIQRKRDTELNAEAVERMKAKGTTFVVPDRAKFRALIAPIQDEVAANLKMTDVLDAGARPREVTPRHRRAASIASSRRSSSG